jgi:hypothetical protein
MRRALRRSTYVLPNVGRNPRQAPGSPALGELAQEWGRDCLGEAITCERISRHHFRATSVEWHTLECLLSSPYPVL